MPGAGAPDCSAQSSALSCGTGHHFPRTIIPELSGPRDFSLSVSEAQGLSARQNPERAPGGTYAPESVRPEQPQPAAFRLNPALRGRDMWYWAGDLTSSTRSWSYESFAFVCGGGRVHAGSHPASFAGGVRPFALPVQPPISRASARQRLMAAIRHFNSQASPRPRSPNCLTRNHLSIR